MPRASTPTNGAAIRAIRERSGLSIIEVVTQLRLEHGLQVHENHLRNVETGARGAGPQLVRALAAVLRVPVVALLTDPNFELVETRP